MALNAVPVLGSGLDVALRAVHVPGVTAERQGIEIAACAVYVPGEWFRCGLFLRGTCTGKATVCPFFD